MIPSADAPAVRSGRELDGHAAGRAPAVAGQRGWPRSRHGARSASQDLGLGVALAAVNVVALLPYRAQQHPLWLALTLVIAQGLPLTWRRSWPVGVGLVIGAARVAYDQLGFTFAPFPLGPAIAFYTIIDRCGPVWRWTACVVRGGGHRRRRVRAGTPPAL